MRAIRNRVGYGLLLLSAVLFYLFENNTGTRILCFTVIIAPMVSAALLYLPRLDVTCQLILPPRAKRAERIEAKLAIQGTGAPVQLLCELRLRHCVTTQVQESVMPVRLQPGAGATTLSFELGAIHSGVLELSLRGAWCVDALGLFRRRLDVSARQTLLIPPQIQPVLVEVSEPAGFFTDNPRYSTQRPGYDPSETFQIREYVPGDPVRQIHWKLSGKTDKLLVRDFGLPVVSEMLLLVETTWLQGSQEPSPDCIDTQLDLLFSLCTQLLQEERSHTVGWYDHRRQQFQTRELVSGEDLDALARSLLRSPFVQGEQTVVGAALEQMLPGSYAHISVISPYVPPDAALLAQGSAVSILVAGESQGELPMAHTGPEIIPVSSEALAAGALSICL